MRVRIHCLRLFATIAISALGFGVPARCGETEPEPPLAQRATDDNQPKPDSKQTAAASQHEVDVNLSPNGHIESREKQGETSVLHGFQAITGPGAVIREYSIYDRGHEKMLVQLYPNGERFREQHRERNGDGSERVFSAKRTKVIAKGLKVEGGVIDLIVQDEICSGRVKAGRCWDGTFLVRELVAFGFELKLHEYQEGKLLSSVPFPMEKIGLPVDTQPHNEGDGKWRWTFPDWPKAEQPARK